MDGPLRTGADDDDDDAGPAVVASTASATINMYSEDDMWLPSVCGVP